MRRLLRAALVPVACVGVAATIAVWLTAPELARLLLRGVPATTAVQCVRLVGIFVPLGALSSCVLAGARGYGRMWPYLAVEGLGKPVLRIALVIAALAGGLDLRLVVAAWCVPIVLGLVSASMILIGLIRRESTVGLPVASPADGKGADEGSVARAFWRFAAPRGFAGTFQVIVLWLNVLLVGAILGTRGAGVYAAVSRLVMIGTFALEGTRLAIGPQLSALLAREQSRRAAELYQVATRWLMIASWPAYVILAIFPAVALRLFGHGYSEGATALVILALAMLVNLGTGNVTVVLLMGGRSSWNLLNTALALTVVVSLNLLLLPHIGIAGAAVAWGASIVVDNLAAVIEVWVVLRMSPFGPSYGAVAAAVGGCYGVIGITCRLLLGDSYAGIGLACAAGTMAYGVLVYAARTRLGTAELVNEWRAAAGRRLPATSGRAA